MRLTKKNMKQAKKELGLLTESSGGNPCYGDGYYAMSLQKKWGDLNKLAENIRKMELELASTEGAGI